MNRFHILRRMGVRCHHLVAVASLSLGGLWPAWAALTDLASSPITNSSAAQAKPNIMLLMDTSGSMGWGHMPDEVETVTGIGSIGYKSWQCNALFYNPNTTYGLPRRADGTFFPTPSFTAAPYDVYNSASSTVVDLSSAFRAHEEATLRTGGSDKNDTPQAAYYYTHSSAAALNYASAPCTDIDTSVSKPASTTGTWTRVLVGASERQNFANWYTYYRTRMALTKSAVSLAFTPLTDSFRVGFITVKAKDSPADTTINASKYLPIADFNTAQRGLWFDKLFSQTPSGSSPAREGLARVGRHYAGQTDGINAGMTGDPVQYSCQQNFTIMTTDGYWNDQQETPGGGPVQIDGTTRVGQQDGTLTDNSGLSPRPIWEGYSGATQTIRNKTRQYAYGSCTSGYFNVATLQNLRSTSQAMAATSQVTRSTLQNLQGTLQNLQSTTQMRQSTTQMRQSTNQNRVSTQQILRSTVQNLRTTSQNTQTTTQTTQTVTIARQSTTQVLRSTTQVRQSTSQMRQSTSQALRSTSQALASTTQMRQSTTQTLQSTSQMRESTQQILRTTTQMLQSTSQVRRSTSQLNSCNAATELCTPVATCSAGGLITCETMVTGPTLVASCTAESATAANNYKAVTCASTALTTNVPVASCTAAAASSGNGYTTTTCTPNNTTNVPVASCTASGPTSGNGYVTTSCPTAITTGPTPVASCTAVAASAGNNYTSKTCTPVNTGPTGVASCAAAAASSGNSYTTTTCTPNNTTNVPVASCTASGPTAGNGFTTISCSPNNTSNVPVASCTASGPTVGNGYTTTTCPTAVTTGPTPVASCTAQAASAGNSYTTTTCPAPITTPPVAVASCTAVAPVAGNSYVATVCTPNNTSNVPVASCAASGPTAGNGYTTTTCTPNNTANVPVASCAASGPTVGNSYTTTTCTPNNTTNVAVASCTASGPTAGNGYTTTTCPAATIVSGPTPVASCTAVAPTALNGYQRTSCATTSPTVGVATCTAQAPTAGNGYTTITCGTAGAANVPVATCTASGPTAGNNYTTTTCPTPIVTTNVPVASCSASAASAGNSWVTTTCPTPITTGPSPTATCTAVAAAAGNSFVRTTCPAPITTGPVGVASCTAAAADAGNNFTSTTCTPNNTTNVPVASCTASGPTSGNGYTTTTCTPNNTTNVPVVSCTASGPTVGNGYTTTTCPTPVVVAAVPVASCTPAAASAGNGYVATVCPAPVVTGPTGVASCTAEAANISNNWTAVSCNTVTTPPTAVPLCANAAGDAANFYTTTTCTSNVTPPTAVASCTPVSATAGNSWTTTLCTTSATGPSFASSCTPVAPSAANGYTATTCTPVEGQKIQFTETTTTTTTPYSGSLPSGASSTATSSTAASDVDGVCYISAAGPSLPALPSPNPQPAPGDASCATWPCTAMTTNPGGSISSLADVAQYYYATDLRPTMTNDVPGKGSGAEDDRATWQHMTTFSIALGVSGTLNYRSDYRAASTGDFAEIRTPDASGNSRPWPVWPDPTLAAWDATGLTYTNKEVWNNARSIDDFWHAAVNGRGQFFSARNPNDVVSGINGALTGIQARLSGASAGVSSLAPTTGNNYVYTANYRSSDWAGDIEARQIDLTTGAVSTAVLWSVQGPLDARVSSACDNRNIYLMRSGATHNLTNFSLNTWACDAVGAPMGTADTGLNATEQAYFDASEVAQLSQYPSMTDGTSPTVNQRGAASGANMVNFLRGQRGLEGFISNDLGKLYRTRAHVLGDIVNGQPIYVKAPFARYQDAGYLDFKNDNSARTPMLYVPANDGMLHAFYAESSATDTSIVAGKEAWAVIPSSVLPNLYKLADANYANLHQYSVDGVPTVADVFDPASSGGGWKTILVGGLNSGGRAYYALDVTDPASPKGLWEFNWTPGSCYDSGVPATASAGGDCHLGYTFGKPVITKLSNGTWVVLVTSGHNNVNSPVQTGDGQGYLYVLNAFSGHIMYKIATAAGSATTPSGLVHINNFVDNAAINNTTLRVYGGDLLGNVWRFDINDTLAPSGREARRLGTAQDSSGNPQPITTRPELAELNNSAMVFVATGRLLGASDLSSTQTQSVYGFVDPLTSASPVYSDLRGALKPRTMVQSGTVSAANATRTVACPTTATEAECGASAGWVVDLPDTGERVNVDMKLSEGTLVIGSNVPTATACSPGGYSWLTYLNFSSGLAVTTTATGASGSGGPSGTGGPVASQFVSGSLIVGLTVTRLPSGQSKTVVSTAAGGAGSVVSSVSVGNGLTMGGGGTIVIDKPGTSEVPVGKRVSWREIAQ